MRYLLRAHIKGRNAITQEPVDSSYEVVQPLSQSDLLVRDQNGTIYRVGRSSSCQIVASQIRIELRPAIAITATNLVLDDSDLYTALSEFGVRNSEFGVGGEEKLRTTNSELRTYLSGTLTIFDADDLTLPTHLDRFDTITIKPGSDIAYARLVSASPQEVAQKLGDYFATGNLIVRTVNVR